MYYDEQIIDGVLHWRGTPTGQWVPKTAQQLTEMLLEARKSAKAPGLLRAEPYEAIPYWLRPDFKLPPATS